MGTEHLDLTALAVFALASSITPGPNTLLVMRSGARFGLVPTGPHVVGIEAGLVGLIVLAWVGVGAMMLAAPWAADVLRWACFGYLLWLAWKVLRDAGESASDPHARPMSLSNAALFQLVNPKAWMMAVTGITAFSPAGGLGAAGLASVIAIFVGIGTVSMVVWALWGAAIHRLLHRPAARRTFNLAMAATLAVTALSTLRTP